jgi:uncharacterized protein YacL
MTSRRLGGLAIGMAVVSWAGLGYVVLTQSPSTVTKALFFPLIFLAIASAVIPCLAWLHERLGHEDEPAAVLRQGAWAGLYVSLVAGLQMARLLDAIVAVVMAAIFVLLEVFLLQRPERVYRIWYSSTTRRREDRSGKPSSKR